MDAAGIAAIITASAVLVAALAGAYVSVRSVRKIVETHTLTTEINRAVNGKEPGESTMVSQVQDLHDRGVSDDEAVLPMLRRIVADIEELKGR